MRRLDVVYSPVCEANAAFIGQLCAWLQNADVELNIIPWTETAHSSALRRTENCFIDVYEGDVLLDSVPLHRDRLCAALNAIPGPTLPPAPLQSPVELTESAYLALRSAERIEFLPITRNSCDEEMQMCLCNYPFGNPPSAFHESCLRMKRRVFDEVWPLEEVAGVYARLDGTVIGLMEALPREVLRRHGFVTGVTGADDAYLSVGCYEVGYGIPRAQMIGDLMEHLLRIGPRFHRRRLEGVGACGCVEGFRPLWVYEKHGFAISERLDDVTFVLERSLDAQAASCLLRP